MRKVAECMRAPVFTTSPDLSVEEAGACMNRGKTGCLPVVQNGKLVGILTGRDVRSHHPNRLVADAMTTAVLTISPQASLWEARELFQKHPVEQLVVTEDGQVVGLLSREHVEAEILRYVDPMTDFPRPELLKEQARGMLENGDELSVIFLDLDNFRTVNKLYGHLTGDEVLRKAARLLREMVEPGQDLVGRYGGDEFVIVSRRRATDAFALAGRLARRLSEELRAGNVTVSVSAGVAGGRRQSARRDVTSGRTLDDLINLASLRSTEAKKRGLPVVGDDEGLPQPGGHE